MKIWGRLTAEDGARLLAGLTRIDGERRRSEGDDARDTDGQPSTNPDGIGCGGKVPAGTSGPQAGAAGRAPSDLAPALSAAAELLCASVGAPTFAPAADVVVHVDLRTLVDATSTIETEAAPPAFCDALDPAAGGTGARLDDGPPLLRGVLQMLACDGRIQSVRARRRRPAPEPRSPAPASQPDPAGRAVAP